MDCRGLLEEDTGGYRTEHATALREDFVCVQRGVASLEVSIGGIAGSCLRVAEDVSCLRDVVGGRFWFARDISVVGEDGSGSMYSRPFFRSVFLRTARRFFDSSRASRGMVLLNERVV
ncbi:hypothetical protein [Natribaculum luteum]|uniref:hypothetical protein n=1 Tax=Natribaculum luteum TaxID=1586232 RepID=UPI003671A23B